MNAMEVVRECKERTKILAKKVFISNHLLQRHSLCGFELVDTAKLHVCFNYRIIQQLSKAK